MDYILRDRRLEDLKRLTARTQNVWDTVKKMHKKVDKKADEPDGFKMVNYKNKEEERTEDSIFDARKAAVAELQQVISDSIRRDEGQAAAFFFPKWKLGGRCLKCQSLHPFTMHREARSEESNNLLSPLNKDPASYKLLFKEYPASACAEDLIFPGCQAVYGSRHPELTTTTTSSA